MMHGGNLKLIALGIQNLCSVFLDFISRFVDTLQRFCLWFSSVRPFNYRDINLKLVRDDLHILWCSLFIGHSFFLWEIYWNSRRRIRISKKCCYVFFYVNSSRFSTASYHMCVYVILLETIEEPMWLVLPENYVLTTFTAQTVLTVTFKTEFRAVASPLCILPRCIKVIPISHKHNHINLLALRW